MGGRDGACLGRIYERRRISRMLTHSRTLRLLLVDGPPGAGKSALARFAVAEAKARGMQVLQARAEARRSGCRWTLSPDVPEVRAWLSGHSDADWRGGGLPATASRPDMPGCLSETGPCLLVLEDAHLADEDTIARARQLQVSAHGLPLVVLITARLFPEPSQLRALRWELDDASCVSLEPLPQTLLCALAEEKLGCSIGPLLRGQVAKAGGNPGLLLGFLDVLQRHQQLVLRGKKGSLREMVDLASATLPQRLWKDLLARVWPCSPETTYWLKLGSVFGLRFPPGALARMAGRSSAELLASLEEPLTLGILAEQEGELLYQHELYRDALYATLPAALLAQLHRDAGDILQDLGAPSEVIGWHVSRGAMAGPRHETVAWLRRTAAELAPSAPGKAAELLEQAVCLGQPTAAHFPALLADAAAAWVVAGDAGRGEESCRRALTAIAARDQRTRLRGYLIEALLHRGRIGLAAEELLRLREDLAGVDVQMPSLMATAALVRLLRGDIQGVRAQADTATRISRASGDKRALSRALLVQALLRERDGDLQAAVRLAGEASACCAEDGLPLDPLPCSAHAMFLIDLDRFSSAQEVLRAQALSRGASWWPFWRFISGFSYFWSGAWTKAARVFEAGMDEAERGCVGWRVAARGLFALIVYGQGDRAMARRWISLADAEWSEGDYGYRASWLNLAKMVMAEAEGAADEGAHWAAKTASLDERGGIWATLGPWTVRCMLEAGQREQAAKVAQKLQDLADRTPAVLGVQASYQTVQGMLADDPVVLAQAAASYAQVGRLFEEALAAEEAASAFARRGVLEQAVWHLEASLACYENLGATTLAARARNRLAREGVRLTKRHRRPATGWSALTSTEWQVLRLIAERRSNPEIARELAVSRRTVETHVSHILGKVGVESRAQLAEQAALHFGWRLHPQESADA